MTKTNILDIFSDNTNNNEEKIDNKEQSKYENEFESFFDAENSIENRVKSFLSIYANNKLEAQEVISDLSTSFLFSPVDNLYYLIKELTYVEQIDISIRYLLVMCVYNVVEKRNLSYDLFLNLLEAMKVDNTTFNSTLYIDLIRYLISNKYSDYNTKKETLYIYLDFLCNYTNDVNYKNQIYKSMYSLYKEKDNYYLDAIIYTIVQIFHSCDDKLKIIISSVLYYEQNIFISNTELINILVQIAENSDTENIKADVADLLLKFNEDNAKTIGLEILAKLQGSKGKRNFYENSQNVHGIDIDSNLSEFIKFLSSKQSLVVDKLAEDDIFEDVKNQILKYKTNEKILQAFNRIYLDANIYQGFTLLTIFIKTFMVIKSHESRDELLKRLIEELEEMSDTCSTGHLIRFANVFIGFGYTIRMKIETEIKSKISHLVNIKINECKEDTQNNLVDAMTSQEENNTYSLFFMSNIDWIKHQLINDYKDILDKDEFEEVFRKAIVFFETGKE